MTELEQRVLHLSQTLTEYLDAAPLDQTLNALTRAAVKALPGVDESSITILHSDGSIGSCAVTAEFLLELDASQYRNQEGPCYDGAVNNAFTVCGDLRNDPRYPRYGSQAVKAGIRSQAGVRIFESAKTIGALNVYSRSL